jgi:hypothetical protein
VTSALRLLALAAALVGCNADIDEPWELDHDRIIAVRAEPPAIMPGETSQIDLFLGYEAMGPEEKRPDFVTVIAPMSLADTVQFDGAQWNVTAPSEERLAAARAELRIEDPTAPVPLQLGVAIAWPTPVMSPEGNGFGASKVVWLGGEGVNPPMNGLLIGGVEPAPDAEIVFSKEPGARTDLYVEADDQVDIVNWLSSCGNVHDFDLHAAYVTFDPEDRTEGQFAVVLRDPLGGVTWRYWNCRVE